MAVELGSVTLNLLTEVNVQERSRLVRHAVPGMDGDLIQTMGRPSVVVTLKGIFYGAEAIAGLQQLRDAYLAHTPLDFFTDAIGEGYFTQVLLQQLDVNQRADYPDQFDFCCEVVEYVEPPAPASANPLGALDTELLEDATAFMDDMQDTLAQVSELADLVANVPNFGNPTDRLNTLQSDVDTVQAGVSVLQGISALF